MYVVNKYAHNWLAKKLINNKVNKNLAHLRGTVADLGCGTRPFESDVLSYADYYIGVDWSNTLHTLSADLIADLNFPLPIATSSVDCTICFEVLEHISEPGVLLSEAYRILHPGGLLLLSAPFQWWVHEAPWDFQRFTRHGLDYQLRKAGFVDIGIEATSGFWSMWLLKFNYQIKRIVSGPRWRRLPVHAFFIPIWWFNQTIGPILDRIWAEDRETIGYFVMARKP